MQIEIGGQMTVNAMTLWKVFICLIELLSYIRKKL